MLTIITLVLDYEMTCSAGPSFPYFRCVSKEQVGCHGLELLHCQDAVILEGGMGHLSLRNSLSEINRQPSGQNVLDVSLLKAELKVISSLKAQFQNSELSALSFGLLGKPVEKQCVVFWLCWTNGLNPHPMFSVPQSCHPLLIPHLCHSTCKEHELGPSPWNTGRSEFWNIGILAVYIFYFFFNFH